MWHRFVRAASTAALCVLAIGTAACSQGSTHTGSANNGGGASASDTSTPVPTAAPLPAQVGKVTQIGTTWQVTVNSTTTNAGTARDKPKAGDTFVMFDVSLKNISGQSQQVSSLLEFRLSDAGGTLYTETVTNFGAPPDGTVASHGITRGLLVFEVPTAQHQFTFSFEPQLSTPVKAMWAVTIP